MKQIKKILVAMILVFALFLVACENKECPECPGTECNPSEVCQGLIDPSTCPEGPTCPEPTCDECPTFNTDKECAAAGWVKECLEGIVAPASVEFYAEDIVVGGTAKFEVEIEPANAFAGLLWLTSDPAIATVAEDGTITGVKPGKVIITAKSVLNGSVSYSEEVEVVERGLQDYEIAEREKNAIVAALQGYVSGSFDLPTTWNASAKVVYTDPNGREITRFEMPDLGEATSQNYALSGSVTYRDSVSEFNVTLKLVKVAEGKNDYEKVQFATEVAEAFLYEYLEGKLVEGDITLPVSVYGVALNWTSNKAYVLANDGKFARPNNNDTVTYTITPKLGAASASKTFAISAKGYTKDEKIAYLLKDGALALANGGKFVGSIALPEYDDKFGIKLAYVSGSPKLISNDGVIGAQAYDTEDQKVTFTVTAIYNDLNAASEAFTEVFTFDTYIAKYNDATQEVINFANVDGHEQFAHYPYGGANYDPETEKEVIIAAGTYSKDNWAFEELNPVKGLENFKVNKDTNEVQLITQYFRYHEATLKATYKNGNVSASYIWTINIGIGAEPHITYLGGRSHSYQASANPNERGDSLQGFSKWDKYVGIVANNNERTSQQYWSEFSGYTAYVDVPTGYNKVIYTLDAEGNITIYPTDEKDHVRQQMFFMEFAVLHIGLAQDEKLQEVQYVAAAPVMITDEEGNEKQKTEVNADGETVGVFDPIKDDGTLKAGYYVEVVTKYDSTNGNTVVKYLKFNYPVLKNFESVRSTYGGNFGSLYVNETGVDLEIPVCSVVVDAGGKFLDGEDIKGAAKASISAYKLVKKDSDEGKALGLTADKLELVVLKDDYGANTSVKREQSWALDGYRPAMMVAPKSGSAILAEGKENVEYKFTFGIELANKNDKFVNEDGTLKASNYAQYGVNSTLSKAWGTPYVVLKAGGLGFAWHSQTLYTFSGMGGGYIAGSDMSLPIYFSRYYRHAENEELSDYIRNDVRTYFMALSGITKEEYDALTKASEFAAIDIQFDDLSVKDLADIEKLYTRYMALEARYKTKADVARAGLALARIKAVADFELSAQKAYIDLTEQLFKEVAYTFKTFEKVYTVYDADGNLTYIAPAEVETVDGVPQYELKDARSVTTGASALQYNTYELRVKATGTEGDNADLEAHYATVDEIAYLVSQANFQAILATAKRNYASLTPAQKEFFDEGYTQKKDYQGNPIGRIVFTVNAKDVDYIEATMSLVDEIINLSDKVTDANKTKVSDTYDKVFGKKNSGGTAYTVKPTRSNGLVLYGVEHKIYLLKQAVNLMATGATTDKVAAARLSFKALGNAYPVAKYEKATAFTANTIYYEKASTATTVDAANVKIIDHTTFATEYNNALKDYYANYPFAGINDGSEWPAYPISEFPWIVINREFAGDEVVEVYYTGIDVPVFTWVPSGKIEQTSATDITVGTGVYVGRTYLIVGIQDLISYCNTHNIANTFSTFEETSAGNANTLTAANFNVKVSKLTKVVSPAEANLANYYIYKSELDLCSDDQAYVAASFKDVKEEGVTTWGLDALFNTLLAQEQVDIAATYLSNIAKTITLASEIKAAAALLPTDRDVRNDGLGSSESSYNSLMKYNSTFSKSGKIDNLLQLYKTLKVATAVPTMQYVADPVNNEADSTIITNYEAKLAKVAKILTSVDGLYTLTSDEAPVSGKVYYTKAAFTDAVAYLTNDYGIYKYTAANETGTTLASFTANTEYYEKTEIGNFSDRDEDDILEGLFKLPRALDEYKADVVESKLKDLPSSRNVAVSDWKAIEDVETAYGKLTKAQRVYHPDTLKTTASLKVEIRDKQRLAIIDPVDALVDALPAASKVKLEDEAAIIAAVKAYNALATVADSKRTHETYVNPYDANDHVTHTTANGADYRADYRAQYERNYNNLKDCYTELRKLIIAAIKEDENYLAAVKAYSETELTGVVNAANYEAAKDLVAKYEALSGHSLECFKTPVVTGTDFSEGGTTIKYYVGFENITTKSELNFVTLYKRLSAAVKAYEAYTTPAE